MNKPPLMKLEPRHEILLLKEKLKDLDKKYSDLSSKYEDLQNRMESMEAYHRRDDW